jgi:hypothetical protein
MPMRHCTSLSAGNLVDMFVSRKRERRKMPANVKSL